jgi:hypothetical protein
VRGALTSAVLVPLVLLAAACGGGDSAPEGSDRGAEGPVVQRWLLPDGFDLRQRAASDPVEFEAPGPRAARPYGWSWYLDPDHPDASHFRVTLLRRDPNLLGRPVVVGDWSGEIAVSGSVVEVSSRHGDRWLHLVAEGIPADRVTDIAARATIESSADYEPGEAPVLLDPSTLLETTRRLDVDPEPILALVDAEDPVLADGWTVRYHRPQAHLGGAGLTTELVVTGRPAGSDVAVALRASAVEARPVTVRGAEGLLLDLGDLPTPTPLERRVVVWDEQDETIIALSVGRSDDDLLELVEALRQATESEWATAIG